MSNHHKMAFMVSLLIVASLAKQVQGEDITEKDALVKMVADITQILDYANNMENTEGDDNNE